MQVRIHAGHRGPVSLRHVRRAALPAVIGACFAAAVAAHTVHRNPHAERDGQTVQHRGDVRHLPEALRNALGELAERPHT